MSRDEAWKQQESWALHLESGKDLAVLVVYGQNVSAHLCGLRSGVISSGGRRTTAAALEHLATQMEAFGLLGEDLIDEVRSLDGPRRAEEILDEKPAEDPPARSWVMTRLKVAESIDWKNDVEEERYLVSGQGVDENGRGCRLRHKAGVVTCSGARRIYAENQRMARRRMIEMLAEVPGFTGDES